MIEIPRPMLASTGGKPFTDPAWVYEIKHDGYRCLAAIDRGGVQLRTRNMADCTRWYPEVAAALAKIAGGPHIIDGEAVCLDDIGRSDFEKLHTRARRRKWYQGCDHVTYAAFDVLMVDGVDVMAQPLVERKRLLRQLVAGAREILFVSTLPAEASLFTEAVLPLKLEGFVAKRLASPYVPGVVSRDWLKVKRPGWDAGRTWKSR